jgi:GTP-binding protein EngB required for normal cell division
MTLLGRRTGLGIADRLDALDQVLTLGRDRIDDTLVAEAGRVAGKAGDRLRFGAAHTVVALAGTTGSGKSSLFNALVGEQVSVVGLRRPTTSVAQAAIWGEPDAAALLDWLQVPRRHVLDRTAGDLSGLVLLDLPDVDSVQQEHRLEADRLVEQVDMLVWVLDPQKYADHSVHDQYLRPLRGHADVMLVVLNQVDRLSAAAREGCVADLGRLLRDDGLSSVPVIAASARTGDGLAPLRAELARRVNLKQASVRRVEADLAALADDLAQSCAGSAADRVGVKERTSLVTALSDAAGADVVADAVARNHRMRAGQATGWPVTRWTSRFRLDPARRLRLRDKPSELVRTSMPPPSALQRARIDSALRSLSEQAATGLADPWPTVLRRAATSSRAELPDLLDRAVAGADLGLGRRPRWWRGVGGLQYLLLAAAIAGLLWLAALFAVAWLQLPDPPLPHWGPVPVPTILLGAGLALGLLVALISRPFAKVGAGRSARRARRALAERVDKLAQDVVIEPVERELAVHAQLVQALARVRG